MAQRNHRRGPGALGRLATRYGVTGRRAAAVALVIALLAAGGAAALGLSTMGGVEVARDEGAAAARQEAPAEGGEAPGEEGPAAPAEGAATAEGVVVVHVDGAGGAPGVYELPGSPRVNDAIMAAGGLAEGADTSGLNLAAPLSDGEKVHVPLAGESQPSPAPSAPGAGEGAGGLVNLNTATLEELDELPGVGEATARAILEDREKNGPFSSPEDLMRVSGIGEKKFEKLEGLVCV